MTAKWEVHPHESVPIVTALHALMVAAKGEPGYLSSNLTTEMDGSFELLYVEEWASERDLKRQLLSNRFAKLAELMERATRQPKIEFSLQSGVRGLDYAEEVQREKGGTD